jgi:hypothetical protein
MLTLLVRDNRRGLGPTRKRGGRIKHLMIMSGIYSSGDNGKGRKAKGGDPKSIYDTCQGGIDKKEGGWG